MAQTLPTNLDSHRFTCASRIVRNLEASQLPASQHDLYLLRFLSLPVTYQMVTYVASYTSAIVDELLRTVPSSRSLSRIKLPDLEDFVLHVCRYSKVSTSTLMVSIIYLFRLRKRMPRQALAIPGTAHRLFLAALIIASKVSNDTCLRNSSWVQASAGLFEIAEVNIMERQFLYLLDFDLVFDEQEAISHFQPVIELLGADLRDLNSYHKVKNECSITQPPPKRPILSFSPFRSGNSNAQVVRRAIIDDEKERLEVRESALRRVARGSQERMARLPRSSLKQALPVATPTPILVVPPSSSSRFASTSRDHPKPTAAPPPLRPSRTPTRSAAPSNVSFAQSTRIPSALSQSAAPETSNISRRSAPLGTVLARAPSTDSISSDSIGGLTADEGTSSSSVSLSDEDLDDEQDADDARVVRVVASLQMMAVGGIL